MTLKKIPGYPRQSLSVDGDLFLDGEPAQVWIGKTGYRMAWIYRGKKRLRHPKPIYKLMAITYLGPRPSKKHLVRHLDGDCHNDSASNLAWGTHKQNMQDLKKHAKSRAKLTKELKADIVSVIKEQRPTSEELRPIAEKFNVSFLTVNRIFHQIRDGKL